MMSVVCCLMSVDTNGSTASTGASSLYPNFKFLVFSGDSDGVSEMGEMDGVVR